MSPLQRYKESRWRLRPAAMTLSALVWAMLWTDFGVFTLLSGAFLGWLVGAVFPLPPMAWRGRLHPWHTLVLIVRLFYDLTVSSFMLLRYTFMRKVDLKAGIIRVDLGSDDDLYQVGVATMISLVPGTVVVEVVRHPRRLYLHCVDVADEDAHDRIQAMTTGVEQRLLRAIGSKEERTALEDALSTPSVVPPTDWAAEEADSGEEAG